MYVCCSTGEDLFHNHSCKLTHTYTNTHIHTHTFMHIRTHTHSCSYVCTNHIYPSMCTYTPRIHTCVHTHRYIHVHACAHTDILMRAHTHICMHICMIQLSQQLSFNFSYPLISVSLLLKDCTNKCTVCVCCRLLFISRSDKYNYGLCLFVFESVFMCLRVCVCTCLYD